MIDLELARLGKSGKTYWGVKFLWFFITCNDIGGTHQAGTIASFFTKEHNYRLFLTRFNKPLWTKI